MPSDGLSWLRYSIRIFSSSKLAFSFVVEILKTLIGDEDFSTSAIESVGISALLGVNIFLREPGILLPSGYILALPF